MEGFALSLAFNTEVRAWIKKGGGGHSNSECNSYSELVYSAIQGLMELWVPGVYWAIY